MSYSNRFSGAITITPPLSYEQFKAAPKTGDAHLGTVEKRVETATGRVTTIVADAIVGPDDPCSGHNVEDDLKALVAYVDTLPEYHALAGHIEVEWDQGFGEPPSRYVVRGGRVVQVKAQIVWPEDVA